MQVQEGAQQLTGLVRGQAAAGGRMQRELQVLQGQELPLLQVAHCPMSSVLLQLVPPSQFLMHSLCRLQDGRTSLSCKRRLLFLTCCCLKECLCPAACNCLLPLQLSCLQWMLTLTRQLRQQLLLLLPQEQQRKLQLEASLLQLLQSLALLPGASLEHLQLWLHTQRPL